MFYPEKFYKITESSYEELERIKNENKFVVGIADNWDYETKSLIVNLQNGFLGIIPKNELTIEDLKYPDGNTEEIPMQAKSKIGKKICAKIEKIYGNTIYLSRKALQEEAFSELKENSMYKVVVTNIVPYGIYVDVACGITAFIHVSEISTTRFKDVSDVNISLNTTIDAILMQITPRLCMSYRRAITVPILEPGEYTLGVVRSELPDRSGYFVELSPNESGIVDTNDTTLEYGETIRCMVKNMKCVSDKKGDIEIQYKLKLIN